MKITSSSEILEFGNTASDELGNMTYYTMSLFISHKIS